MTFREAADYVMPFGKYKGQTLAKIAAFPKGLLYLDWLCGEREKQDKATVLDMAITTYLGNPTIKDELDYLTELEPENED